jgi:hypothetical protein
MIQTVNFHRAFVENSSFYEENEEKNWERTEDGSLDTVTQLENHRIAKKMTRSTLSKENGLAPK